MRGTLLGSASACHCVVATTRTLHGPPRNTSCPGWWSVLAECLGARVLSSGTVSPTSSRAQRQTLLSGLLENKQSFCWEKSLVD